MNEQKKAVGLTILAMVLVSIVITAAAAVLPQQKPLQGILEHCQWRIIRPGRLPAISADQLGKFIDSQTKDNFAELKVTLRDGTEITLVRTNMEEHIK